MRVAVKKFRQNLIKPYPFTDEKIIWIKTPKCAGTSVQNGLSDAGYLHMMEPGKRVITGVYGPKIEEFKTQYPEFWEQAYKFAIVRNPYDKFVSGWKYLPSTRERSLAEVLKNLPSKSANHHDWVHLTLAQSDYLCDSEGKLRINRVIHLEDIENGLNSVLREQGLPEITLPFDNITKNREQKYMKCFDDESLKLFELAYKDDIEHFGYKFGE